MKRTAFASLFAFALAAGAAEANQPYGNVVGGGGATISGGGDDMAIAYSAGGAGGGAGVLSQPGRLARFAGSHGDGQTVEYLGTAPAGTGRGARLVGGGDNAEVVYDGGR
jgi:hypothetical protein